MIKLDQQAEKMSWESCKFVPRVFLLVWVSDESSALNRCIILYWLARGSCVVAGAPGTRPAGNRANQFPFACPSSIIPMNVEQFKPEHVPKILQNLPGP